jgi:SAM-dependent methyltransferase
VTTSEILPAGGDTSTPLNLRKRLGLIRSFADSLAGKSVIDCGCGGGEYVRALRDSGANAFGIEYQRGKIPERRTSGHLAHAAISVADIQRLPFTDGEFDLALVNEVLEHVPDDLEGLREVRRILKPNGMLVVFSPNRLYPFETHGVFLRRSERRIPHYTPLIPYLPLPIGRLIFRYWARNYWPWELRALIHRAGFEVVTTSFVWQTFENISGHQPAPIRRLSPALRSLASVLERVPVLRSFGVSQAIVARPGAIPGPS